MYIFTAFVCFLDLTAEDQQFNEIVIVNTSLPLSCITDLCICLDALVGYENGELQREAVFERL